MSGYVYFIGARECAQSPVKIGFTRSDPTRRLAALQTGCPFDLELLCFVKAKEHLERRLHATFAPLHLRGEWFAQRHKLAEMIGYMTADGIGHLCRDNILSAAIHDCVVGDGCGYDGPPSAAYTFSADASLWRTH